jgi:hypothetical protein
MQPIEIYTGMIHATCQIVCVTFLSTSTLCFDGFALSTNPMMSMLIIYIISPYIVQSFSQFPVLMPCREALLHQHDQQPCVAPQYTSIGCTTGGTQCTTIFMAFVRRGLQSPVDNYGLLPMWTQCRGIEHHERTQTEKMCSYIGARNKK